MTFSPSKDSDQPGHPPSLIRVFAVRMKKSWVLSYQWRAQRRRITTGRMSMIIWVFAGKLVSFWFCQALANFMLKHYLTRTLYDQQARPICARTCRICTTDNITTKLQISKDLIRRTVMILSFRTDMPGQTVQTQIRLLLEEQSDQSLHCLPFRLHHLDSLLYGRAT